MHYDSVKNVLMRSIKVLPGLRKVFFLLLDLLFLRQWYVKRAIKKNSKTYSVLRFYDAGAGFCQYSDYILSRYKNSSVLASDLKEDYLQDFAAYANHKYPGRFAWICADLVEFIPEGKFELIVAIDILEHIENDLQVLKNFHDSLVSGGKLIISTPSDQDEAAKFTAEHVRPGYSEQELRFKLTAAGFTIIQFKYSYGKWGKLSWKLAIKLPISMISYYKVLLLVLPIYYICLYPLIYLLMIIDISRNNKQGNGIIIIAEKSLSAS